MSQQTLYNLYTLGARWQSSFGSDCTQIREFSWSGVLCGTVSFARIRKTKILLDFTSNLGSIVPLFPVEKNKKNIIALLFSQTELPKCRRLGGGRPMDGLREIHFILFLGFRSTDVAGLHVIHF